MQEVVGVLAYYKEDSAPPFFSLSLSLSPSVALGPAGNQSDWLIVLQAKDKNKKQSNY